jgi:hypothetical protein
MGANERKDWEEYCARELESAEPLLRARGFALDQIQVHTGGERYLMASARDVGGGGRKLVLTGHRVKDGLRVVIKVSSDRAGIREIERERMSRTMLHKLDFARGTFSSPDEILYESTHNYLLYITSYITETQTFMEHELEDQFFLALQAFETQEGVQATTYAHAKKVEEWFGLVGAEHYINLFEQFRTQALSSDPQNTSLAQAFDDASQFLHEHRTIIERYSGFLTHSDFSPQNMRIEDRTLYLLDYASMHFGNKYESWARLINFMTQHNPPLESALTTYVRENRGEEEYLSLRLMRVYKLGFLLQFWTGALARSEGNLHTLVRLRITFWTEALKAVLTDTRVSKDLVQSYLETQATLRSEDEKARQREILARK